MRCLGRTKSFSRCKNNCKFIFCRSHRLQWWAIVVIIATLGGLFQDILKPLFFTSEPEFVVVQSDPKGLTKTSVSPNAYEDMARRFKKLGALETFEVNNKEDFKKPISFLEQFIETKDKINLSPLILSLEIIETKLNRKALIEKVSAVDAREQVRSYQITNRFPLKISIYPEAIIPATKDTKIEFEF